MRTIQLIISALADSVVEARGKSTNEASKSVHTESKDLVQKSTTQDLPEKNQQLSDKELDDMKEEE